MMITQTVLVAIGFLVLSSPGLGESESSQVHGSSRITRSIKDALPKDDGISQARAIIDMRHKISGLENSLTSLTSEVESIREKDSHVEEVMVRRRNQIFELQGEVALMKRAFQSHASSLSDLESLTSPDDNLFILSNQTCGEVLVGQSGSIVFSSYGLRGTRHPLSCIWSIRANNRAFIKVTSNLSPRNTYTYPGYYNAYVVEVMNLNENNTDIPSPIKITKIQRTVPHIFSGPVIFIIFHLGPHPDDYVDVDLHLQFEGMGKLINRTTFFSHVFLHENTGNFTNSQIAPYSGPSSNPKNLTEDYTTIVISNFMTKAHLQVELFNGGGCPNAEESFLVITNVLEAESMQLVDCCKKNCTRRNSLISYDNPFIILIRKKFQFQRQLKFNLTWVAETPYPSSSKMDPPVPYTYKCGDVLGGISGTILYKPHVSYRNGERCIWVVVPQPRPRSSIILTVGANGVETTYDHLYMMELTNSSGDPLPEPKITRIGRYGTYEAHSRELYIVFYSDSSVTGYGFSLSWRSSGDLVKIGGDITTRFRIFKNDNGFASADSTDMTPTLASDLYQVFILTPVVPFAYVYGMELHLNQTGSGPNFCLHPDITVFTAMDGTLAKTEIDCSEPGQARIENADGMGMIIMNNRESSLGQVGLNFSWREVYGEGNASYVSVENNNCGGIISGEKGILKYKIGLDYLNNERCVWLLHSPNHTSITLKLQKDGFETCCDYLLITSVEPLNGTFRNDTVILNRANRSQTFEESLLVIVFRSDASTRGRGFALQFTSSGEAPPPTYRYQLRHHNEPFGTVAYPSSEWEEIDPSVQDVFVIASSLKIGMEEDPLITPTNISWGSGLFWRESQGCTYDSITFYTTPEQDGWLERARYPTENDTQACPTQVIAPGKNDIFSTVYSAFVAIYKPVVREEEETRLRMEFSFEKTAGCGGVIIGDSGEINYKLNGRYSNQEKCIWLIHAPQASQIRFWLERSGFEECCDLLVVNAFNAERGTPQQAAIISRGNRTATVEGPLAIVTFTSDSSVVGEGFRLSFSTQSTLLSDPPYTFHLEHRNQPKQHNFAFEVPSNEIVIVAYSPEIFRNSHLANSKTEVEVLSFRPQTDERCLSDTLTIYNVFGRDRALGVAKTFTASYSSRMPTLVHTTEHSEVDSDETGCHPLDNENYHPCDDILDCGDAPEDNRLITNSTSYLVVYRSRNVSSDGLHFRGFVMTSNTTPLTFTISSS